MRRLRFRMRRFDLLFLVGCAVVGLAVSGFAWHVVSRQQQRYAVSEFERAALDRLNSIQRELQAVREDVQGVRAAMPEIPPTCEAFRRVVRRVQEGRQVPLDFVWRSPAGAICTYTMAGGPSTERADRLAEWFLGSGGAKPGVMVLSGERWRDYVVGMREDTDAAPGESSGAVTAFFRLADVTERALSYLTPKGVRLEIFDSNAKGESLLYRHRSRKELPGSVWLPDFERNGAVTIGTRNWTVRMSGLEVFFLTSRDYGLRYGLLAFGLAATGLLTLYGYTLQTRHRTIERQVRQRTAAWQRVNRKLQRDIVMRDDAAQLLEEAHQRALDASRLKSQFVANVSHEIRTPMNAVLGLTELALHTELSREQRSLVSTARDSAKDLLGLLNGLLDLSRLEAGKLQLTPERIEVAELVHGVAQQWKAVAQEKGLALSASVEEGTPGAFWADRGRVRQILVNFVHNALKFTRSGGVLLQVWREDVVQVPHVVFAVTDTGAGIPPDKLEEIFLPFRQADQSDSRVQGGAGLGLAITEELVRAMGGSFGVESTAGKGSRFWFRMPATQMEPPVAATGDVPGEGTGEVPRTAIPAPAEVRDEGTPCAVAPARRTSGQILVAEDNRVNQFVLRSMLERLGFAVETADDGEQAVAAAQKQSFDAILMDCQMPVMDGLEATRQLRALGCTTPIIACTASAMHSQEQVCREAGMTGFLSKPISLDTLQQVLSSCLNRAIPV